MGHNPFSNESVALGFNNPTLVRSQSFEKAYDDMKAFMEDQRDQATDLQMEDESILNDIDFINFEAPPHVSPVHVDLLLEDGSILNVIDDINFERSPHLSPAHVDILLEDDSILNVIDDINFERSPHVSPAHVDILLEDDSILNVINDINFERSPHASPRHESPAHVDILLEDDSVLNVINDINFERSPHVSPRHRSPHRASPRHASPHRASPRHASPHRASPRHASPHRASPRHASPHHVSPRHASPHHASPRHVSPHHASPRHVSPRRRNFEEFYAHEPNVAEEEFIGNIPEDFLYVDNLDDSGARAAFYATTNHDQSGIVLSGNQFHLNPEFDVPLQEDNPFDVSAGILNIPGMDSLDERSPRQARPPQEQVIININMSNEEDQFPNESFLIDQSFEHDQPGVVFVVPVDQDVLFNEPDDILDQIANINWER